jgi:hypothetical protein
MYVRKMSSSMRNFMEAYSAVHNTEAREELSSGRDHISEMDLSHLTSGDLVEIAEQVLEVVFETLTVKEAHEVVTSVFDVETGIEGRANKVDRLNEAFNSAFAEVGTKAASVALEHFAQYRHNKKLQETWTARFNQEKRVARVHGRLVAEEVASVRARLLTMIDEKAQKCWDTHKKVGMKMKGGKLVNNCVPKNEGYMALPKEKMARQADKAYGKEQSAASKGDEKETNKQMQRRIAMKDPAGRKASLKKEEVELEEKKMSKAKHKEEAKKGKRWQDSDGDGKWYEKGDDVAEAIDAKGAARMDAAKGKKKETQDQIDKRLMLGKYSPAVKYAKMKKEGVSFSQKELDAFEAVVNSWED